ncbi:MAG: hypothetical protein LBJ89_04275 [Holosporales bacterium]|jgi:hypothetical protein|nr:hypothetical protein [Holosporales bacterium]
MFSKRILICGVFVANAAFPTPFDEPLSLANAKKYGKGAIQEVIIGANNHGTFLAANVASMLDTANFVKIDSSKQGSLGHFIRRLVNETRIVKGRYATLENPDAANFDLMAFGYATIEIDGNFVDIGLFNTFAAKLDGNRKRSIETLEQTAIGNIINGYANANNIKLNTEKVSPEWCFGVIVKIAPMAVFYGKSDDVDTTYIHPSDLETIKALLKDVVVTS